MLYSQRRLALLLFFVLCITACSHSPQKPSTPRYGLLQSPTTTPAQNSSISANDSCLSSQVRSNILDLASPENFIGNRYRKGPRSREKPEKETDCSSFVHEIYRRAGLSYPFYSSREILHAPEFEHIKETDAQPGDLVVFRGHMGILDKEGLVLSATKIRSRRQPSSITRLDKSVFHGRRTMLRYKCSAEQLAKSSPIPTLEQETP